MIWGVWFDVESCSGGLGEMLLNSWKWALVMYQGNGVICHAAFQTTLQSLRQKPARK